MCTKKKTPVASWLQAREAVSGDFCKLCYLGPRKGVQW